MNILIDDSIELWLLKLRINISDRLKPTGLIPDVCNIILEYAQPCRVDKTFLDEYLCTFSSELVVGGITRVLVMKIGNFNYTDYSGCSRPEHDDIIVWPHMEVFWGVFDRDQSIELQTLATIRYSDIFRCFDMSSEHIDILARDMTSNLTENYIPVNYDMQYAMPEFRKLVREFMDTFWFIDKCVPEY